MTTWRYRLKNEPTQNNSSDEVYAIGRQVGKVYGYSENDKKASTSPRLFYSLETIEIFRLTLSQNNLIL
jgi:hypothetical protein